MLERKVAAKSAASIFYEEYNDIDIFIEDTAPGYRKIFKELLSNALNSKFKIQQVFPVGDRSQVIRECEKHQEPNGRKKLFIIDGDLHLLNGQHPADLKGLFELPRYCIENFLIDENAIIQTAYEEDSDMEIEDIATTFDFNGWLTENEPLLMTLFIFYALCIKHIPSEQTVGYKVSKLCSSNSGIVCSEKIEARIEDLKAKLTDFLGEDVLQEELKIIKERIATSDKKLIRYVSAKDYILPLIITRLQSFLKFSPTQVSLRVRLANRSDASELGEIENYIFE